MERPATAARRNADEALTSPPAGWSLACPDWPARIRTGRSLVPDLPLTKKQVRMGETAVKVFDKLRLSDVPGTPTMAEAGGEWFRKIVRALFAAVDPVTRTRWIRELLLLVPKKNNKTTGGALLMLTALLLNLRPRASFIMTAPVQDTADLAFSQAAGAIQLDQVLQKKLHVVEHRKTIIHRETKAALEIMTFDPSVLTGVKVSGGALVDELHVCAKMAKAASAIRQLRGGMMPFPEAFLWFITTQSEEPPSGVFDAELTKARSIRDGKASGTMLPVLYEFPPEMQMDKDAWRNPANWSMVTPNIGKSVTLERLEEGMADAEGKGEGELRAWASQHLNVEIGVALKVADWAGASFWERQGDASLTLDEFLKRVEVVDVGIDGGGLDDLLGLALAGRDKKTKAWLSWGRAWAHKIVLERRKQEAPRFKDFQADGDLVIVAELGKDLTECVDICARVQKLGLLDKIGLDPSGVGGVLEALVKAGVPKEKVIGISQGWRLTGAIKTTERTLASRTLFHGARRLMAWCVGNAKVEPRGNAILITKQASGTAKIDPLMALFNAIQLLSLNPPAMGGGLDNFLKNPVTA